MLLTGEKLFQALIEHGWDGVALIAADGKVTFASPSMALILGTRVEEIEGTNAVDRVHPEDRARLGEIAGRLLGGTGEIARGEWRCRHSDGSWLRLEGRAANLLAEPAVEAIVVNLRDVTQARKTEEALEAATRDLERTRAEFLEFAYVASHDLQEPLRMVAGYTQLLAKRYKDELGPDAGEFIGFTLDGVVRMNALINDLLTYARTGTQEKALSTTDADSVFERALDALKGPIAEAGAVVTRAPLPLVMADAAQLAQVVHHVVGNAIKFRSPETPHIHIAGERRGSHVIFSVEDNGIGIDGKDSERIFSAFQRLHSYHEYPGTGMGLAVCRKIVERHGGRIWVESEPGRGSVFYFTMPAVES